MPESQPTGPRVNPGARHFTLIELLVVVAIIAILCALLMPSLQHSRDLAKSMSCMSNVKQFGIGFMSYSGDYSSYLPCLNYDLASSPSNSGWWMNIIANGGYVPVRQWWSQPYGSVKTGAWRCPAVQDSALWWGGGYGVHECSKHFSYGTYPRLTAYRRTSQLLMLSDSWQRNIGVANQDKTSWIGVTCPPNCNSGLGWNTSSNWHEVPSSLHGGGAGGGNVLFFDGHAAMVRYSFLAANQNDIFGWNSK